MTHEEKISEVMKDIVSVMPLTLGEYIYIRDRITELYTEAIYSKLQLVRQANARPVEVFTSKGIKINEYTSVTECIKFEHISRNDFFPAIKTGIPVGRKQHIYKYKDV
jgi:hypothetical protein